MSKRSTTRNVATTDSEAPVGESIETTQIYLDISEDDVAMAHRKYAG